MSTRLNKEELELEKLAKENQKLEREIHILSAPWWRRSGLWAVVIPTGLALATLATGYFTNYFSALRTQLEYRTDRLKADAEELEKQKSTLTQQTRSLETDRVRLAKEKDDVAHQLEGMQQQLRAAQVSAMDALREATAATITARCSPLKFVFFLARWQGMALATLPKRAHFDPLNDLAKNKLGWPKEKLDDLAVSISHWPNLTWRAVARNMNTVNLAIVEKVLANEVANIWPRALSKTDDDRFTPTEFDGKHLLDEAGRFLASGSPAITFLAQTSNRQSAEEHAAMRENLFFVVRPTDYRYVDELKKGVEAQLPDDKVRTFAEELIRHHRAHGKVAKIIDQIEATTIDACR